jgi:hypothetical protein
MNAYFNIIKAMLYMMIVICISNLPLFYLYSSSNSKITSIASLSLGNMGGAFSICESVPQQNGNVSLDLNCPSGSLNTYAQGKLRSKDNLILDEEHNH